jgi:murein DD-endopeptidase MepM/ murein hydrolase activator NlpD
MTQGSDLDVYTRSNLYNNLVKAQLAGAPGWVFWLDSGDGAVNYVSGNCGENDILIESAIVNNPVSRPTYTHYPLKVTNPGQAYPNNPYYELYQFAIRDPFYTTTVYRHPGTDFFQGPVDNNPSIGLKVVAVGDGEIIGFYDPSRAADEQLLPAGHWTNNASPTDRTSIPNRAYVVIRHGNTIVVYAHLQPGLRIGKNPRDPQNGNPGDPVVAGQWIGMIAGHESGPHLHQEVRTYGLGAFNVANTAPLIFVNGWQYFTPTIQGYINQNLQNRQDDKQDAAADLDGTYDLGKQRTQCFLPSNPPAGAPPTASAGITIYGRTKQNGVINDYYSAFEWIDGTGTPQTYVLPVQQNPWTYYCVPQ